jgi:hypothetical protein
LGSSSKSLVVLCCVLVVAIVLAYTAVNAVVRPVIWSDSGWGLLAWDLRHGLPWNHWASPDQQDIGRDTSSFMSIWSPGQAVVPGLLEEAGLSLGHAVIATDAIFSVLGLVGWFVLYRALGFPAHVAAIALALIACSRGFAFPFVIFIGGEVLLFGVAPWFMLLVWKLRELRWFAVPPLVIGVAVMFFAKISALILACAAISAAVLSGPNPWRDKVDTVRRGLFAGLTIAIVGIVFYFAWYSRGWTAASTVAAINWSSVIPHAVFILSCVWGAALSFGELGNFLFLRPSRAVFGSQLTVGYLLALPAAVTLYLMWRQLRRAYPEYLVFAVLTTLAYGTVFLWLWVHGAVIGQEERYFRPLSLLLLVGAVHAFLTVPSRLLRLAGALMALVGVFYGLAGQARHVVVNLGYPLGIRDFRHSTADEAVVKFIRTIDVPSPDRASTLIFVPSPEIALEVRNVRVMANHADFWAIEDIRNFKFRGRVPRLYVIVQKRLVGEGKAQAMVDKFVDYKPAEWKEMPLGDFVCFYVVD